MPDALVAAFATPGLAALIIAMAIAGLVRGFTGFGTALIFVPVAGIYLPPADVIFILTITGVLSNVVLLPRALRDGEVREVGLLSAGALVMIPLGIWLMTTLEADIIRWIVSVAGAFTLICLISGWRYQGEVASRRLPFVGAGAGLLGGMTGLTGPVVILFYLAGTRAVSVVRANTILFLASLDIMIAAILLLSDLAAPELILVGILIAGPYLVTSAIGQRMFDPSREAVYRLGAYLIIAGAVLRGLPIWG
ncbi:sulfite exporter TauE/SafE family protein [Primorskyibacter sp. S187A]|uniref:sulfite exporter TauE/SafE family protein n=1 Tax=Primorskyibacter sp. S187A TaxID=3415130 RepID=UPI003C7E26B4